MRTGRAAAVLCLLGIALLASDRPQPVRIGEAILRDAALLEDLGAMARQASSRCNAAEVAAFVVQKPGGGLELVLWPDQWAFGRQVFRGSIPAGTIAIVHTHPAKRSPKPSVGDCKLARSSGLAVVALSRWAIWVIEPDAQDPIELVSRRNWTAQPAKLALK